MYSSQVGYWDTLEIPFNFNDYCYTETLVFKNNAVGQLIILSVHKVVAKHFQGDNVIRLFSFTLSHAAEV